MPSFGVILFALIVTLLSARVRLLASDENPWSMDDTDQGGQSNFSIDNKGGLAGSFRSWDHWSQRQQSNQRSGESVVPKTRSGLPRSVRAGSGARQRTGLLAPGKSSRDEAFGYVGSPLKNPGNNAGTSGFGAFPSVKDRLGRARLSGETRLRQGQIEFGGKVYGAFPPMEHQANGRKCQSGELKENSNRSRKVPRAAFPNVPPLPIPDPIPERGYFVPYGIGPPYLGLPLYPSRGLGPVFQDPALYGYMFSGALK